MSPIHAVIFLNNAIFLVGQGSPQIKGDMEKQGGSENGLRDNEICIIR